MRACARSLSKKSQSVSKVCQICAKSVLTVSQKCAKYVPKVCQKWAKCPKSVTKVSQSYSKYSQKCEKSVKKVCQKCPKKCQQSVQKVSQKCGTQGKPSFQKKTLFCEKKIHKPGGRVCRISQNLILLFKRQKKWGKQTKKKQNSQNSYRGGRSAFYEMFSQNTVFLKGWLLFLHFGYLWHMQQTKIGFTFNAVSKEASDERVKRACKDLLKTWKKLEEGDKGGKEEISSSKKEEESQVKEPAKDKVKKTDFLRSG